MAPKEAPPAEAEQPEEPEEPAEPEIHKKCFRIGGQVYYGECKKIDDTEDFVRHGYGKQVFSADTTSKETVVMAEYEGHWSEDVINGHGNYKWADGSSYEGNFLDGKMHGYGRYQWPEGSSYTGTWADNQMSGPGRFDSAFDGDFLQGTFSRNCFQQHNGQWLDVHREHRKAERLRIADGEPRGINIVRCTNPEAFDDAAKATLAENLIPLVVADETFQGDLLTLVKPCSKATTVSIPEVALAKRRQRDYCNTFYQAIKQALERGDWLTIAFDAVSEENPQAGTDDNAGSGPSMLPDEWRLEHFFDKRCLPLEAFDLKLFNGRRMSQFYLPEEGKADTEPVTEDDDGAMPTPEQLQEMEEQPQVVYNLRMCIVTLGRIAAEMSDSEVRAGIIAQYGTHVPLHRAQIILLSEDSGYDQTGFDTTQRPY